jgi:hypothetical protein
MLWLIKASIDMGLNTNFEDNNTNFIQGLKFELGDGVKVDHQRALQFYQKGSKQGNFLSLLKVKRTRLRLLPTILLPILSLVSLVVSSILGSLWVGLLISFSLAVIQIILDDQYYWYVNGLGYLFYRFNFLLAFLVYLPAGTLVPYFTGISYFPILFLLVVSVFIIAAGILLWLSNQENKFIYLFGYGFILLLLSTVSYAIPSDGVKFETVLVEGGIKIVSYRVSQPIVTIPTRINNSPVVEIGDQAFAYTNITKVHIGDHVKKIGVAAFANTPNLEEVWIEDGVPLSAYMFANTPSLVRIRIPSETEIIPSFFLYQANQLEEMSLPDDVKAIGHYSFYDTLKMPAFPFPESLEIIGHYAFSGAKQFKSVVLPNSLYFLGDGAFSNIEALTSFSFSNQLNTIPDFLLQNSFSLESFEIPDHITTIGAYAFHNAYQLTELKLHDGITTIKEGAFRNNTSLTRLDLPSSLSIIESYTFMNNRSLNDLSLPNNLESIGVSAFQNNDNLEQLTFPQTLTSIGANAFKSVP